MKTQFIPFGLAHKLCLFENLFMRNNTAFVIMVSHWLASELFGCIVSSQFPIVELSFFLIKSIYSVTVKLLEEIKQHEVLTTTDCCILRLIQKLLRPTWGSNPRP